MDLTELHDLYPHEEGKRYLGRAGEILEYIKRKEAGTLPTEEEIKEQMKRESEQWNNPLKVPKKLD